MSVHDRTRRRTLAAVLAFAAPVLVLGACNDDPLFDLPPDPPTNVAAVVNGQDVTINWTPGVNATSQEVRLAPVVAVPASAGNALQAEDYVAVYNDNTTNTHTFTDVEPGAYTATVTAINASSRAPSEIATVTVQEPAGDAPVITAFYADEEDPTTLIVEWTGVEGAENYQVSLTADDDTGDFLEIATASATSFPFSPVNPGTTYTAEVCLFTQSGGVGECGSTVNYTVPVNTAPVAVITAPADASEFFDTELLTFTGTGTDAEDGALTGESLAWSSDVDGAIATGDTLVLDASLVSLGAHVITLTATDSQGATGEASINITINQASSVISFPALIQSHLTTQGCTGCHGGTTPTQGISLDSWEGIVRGEAPDGDPLIVIGDAADPSAALLPVLGVSHMGVAATEPGIIASFEQWINDGAPSN